MKNNFLAKSSGETILRHTENLFNNFMKINKINKINNN